jgi:conjugal transfer pilus assembly protein TraB
VGGFLSGLGSFLSQSPNAITFSPMSGLAQTNPLSSGELLKHGAAKGVSGALERYADFYIKRAEQMQPVIQVQAGRTVDIVFTQGVAFGDSVVRGALAKVNDQQRYQQIHQTQAEASIKPVEAWLPSQGETHDH